MNTNQHEQIEADLKAFLDGELSFLRRKVVARHIKNCQQCQQEIEFMQTIEKELETVETTPLDTDLRSQILEAVPTSTKQEDSPISTKKVRTNRKLEIGFTLAGLAIAYTVLFPVFGGRARENARRSSPQSYVNNAPALGRGPALAPAANDAFSSSAGTAEAENKTIIQSGLPTERAIHREGNLSVVVDNAEAASTAVESIVKNTSGFIANNSLSTGSDGKRSANLDLRIPVAEFSNVVEKISKLGKVSAKSISGEDITAKVAKAGATKNTLSKELSIREAQLRQKEKAARKADANALYYLRQEVRSLRVQASQARAELETLQKFAALSNLYVTLQDKEKPVAPVGWTNDINQTGRSAWSSFQSAAKLPIQLIIWVLAYSPLWLPALIVWKKFGKKWIES